MTVTISRAAQGIFDPETRDSASRFTKFARAIAGTRAQKQTALSEMYKMADFIFEATTTTVSEGATFVAAGVNLSTKLVTFPADTARNVRVRTWYRQETTAKIGYTDRVFTVNGGTNPTLAIVPSDLVFATTAGVTLPSPIPDGRVIAAIPVGSAATPAYPFAEVAIATTPTPDEVYVRVSAPSVLQGGNSLRWRVEVFLEPLVLLAAPPA